MFSKTCEYAIRALVCVGKHSLEEKVINIKDISNSIDSPEAFTAKIVQQLSKNKLITSIKGPNGGYILEISQMKSIKMLDVVEIFEGKGFLTKCVLGLAECNSENPCAFHNRYVYIRNLLKTDLMDCSLYDVVKQTCE